jgi:predicted aldo/keto reductase-like oxidoreductase
MKLNKILIGSMRLGDRGSAAELIRRAIDAGFHYIDSAPLYRYQSEEENSESWVGNAVHFQDYRDRVMISSKSATSNGRLQLGDFVQSSGFGVRSAEQFGLVFQQSLKRMNIDRLDFYHLWICHTDEQFQEAFRQGGWYEGYLKEKAAGRVGHLGITTHADADTIIGFLETGRFETVTLPLNVLNRTRIKAVEYCREKKIPVIAMNPLGGGFLAADEKIRELAYKYLLSLDNVHILLGFTSAAEVDYAVRMKAEYEADPVPTDKLLEEVEKMIPDSGPRCTGCGYCQPCPQFIDIGASLSYYNLYKYLGMEDAKATFNRLQWNARYNLNKCISCGICENRCPNELPVREIVRDAVKLMY